MFFGLLIVLNCFVMAAESQYNGLGVGYDIGYANYRTKKQDSWPGGKITFEVLDMFFGGVFTIEIIIKVLGLGRGFFIAWNIFDVVVMFFWYLDKLAGSITLPIDMMMLRLLRLARLLRLLKLAKSIAGFDQLFLMITALKGSFQMLTWAALLLFSCLTLFAFILNQTLVSYFIENDTADLKARQRAFHYFGTFSRSILSMFELTIGNWIPINRFLIENVSEWFTLWALFFKLTFGFAVIAVINGCFIKETFKVAAADDLLMVLEREKEVQTHLKKMSRLISMADSSGEGKVDKDEFMTIVQDKEVKHWLAAQGLDTSDAGNLFKLMDDGSGDLSAAELVRGVSKLKGAARSLDLAMLVHNGAERENFILQKIEDVYVRLATDHLDDLPAGLNKLDQIHGLMSCYPGRSTSI
jgi:hypothetical protein